MALAELGIVGLAAMGSNLARNAAGKGHRTAVYDREAPIRAAFLRAEGGAGAFAMAEELEELPGLVARPRKLLLMVKAGQPVDAVLERLLPCLEPGDVVIDGGNSHWSDTARRQARVKAAGVLYVGAGVSGGSRGARLGPAIMPGGDPAAWPVVKDLLEDLSARAPDGMPCCRWMGPKGAGHFVKTVHNGIEYGEMQLIGEVCLLMREGLGMSAAEAAEVFRAWGRGPRGSYLIQITGEILARTQAGGTPLVDQIADQAEQKGTGGWAVSAALELGVPAPLIGAAVSARALSAQGALRRQAAGRYPRPEPGPIPDRAGFLEDLGQALYGGRLAAFAQGTELLAAARQWGWALDWGEAALVWRAGCILRSPLLEEAAAARRRGEEHLLLDREIARALAGALPGWRRAAAAGAAWGLPLPALSAGLAYVDGLAAPRDHAAALIQAQRDCFGAHTYGRVDRPGRFHTDWLGED